MNAKILLMFGSLPFHLCWLMLGCFLSTEKRRHIFFTTISTLPFWGWNNKRAFSHASECLTSGVKLRFCVIAKCVTKSTYVIFLSLNDNSFIAAAVCFFLLKAYNGFSYAHLSLWTYQRKHAQYAFTFTFEHLMATGFISQLLSCAWYRIDISP